MQAVIGALRVNLGLDSAVFDKGLDDARSQLRRVGGQMQRIGRDMALSVTAPLVGIGALTLKTAGDFEASMNRVRAALGSGDDEFAALQTKARELGKTTQFTASEAANAIEILAKNGVSAADILGGALDASLTLAAASSAEMGSAADVATDVMLQFGKSAADLGSVVDGVTGVLLESKFGFDDYRLALGQAGGVAGGLGVELEEFNAVIAATSSSFASGSDAGTSFKAFLQRLTPASKPAEEAMKALGLEFFDAAGNMRDMSDVAEELRQGVSGLSEEARNAALQDIFGQDAIRTAIALSREGADGIRELTAAIGEASAADQAAARMEGLNGSIRKLQSAFQELQLAIADSGLIDAFTSFVEKLTGIISSLSETNPRLLRLGVVFGTVAAALSPILISLGLLVTALAAISAPALAVVAGIAAITAAAVAFSPQLQGAKDAVIAFKDGIVSAMTSLADDILEVFRELPAKMVQVGIDIIEGLKNGINAKIQSVKDSINGAAQGMVDGVKGIFGIQSPSKVFRQIGVFLMEGLGQGVESGAGDVRNSLDDFSTEIGSSFKSAFKGMLLEGKSFASSMGGILSSIGGRMVDTGLDSLFSSIKIPGFAMGTNFAPGGVAMVGEKGPELVNLPRGSQVIPNKNLGGGIADVRVSVDNDGNLQAFVERVSSGVTRQGISAYDRSMPGRVQSINRDPRAR